MTGAAPSGSRRRLLVFGKPPTPGQAKTRLAPLLGEEGAARLYRAFLADVLAAVRQVDVEERELWMPEEGGAGEAVRLEGDDLTGFARRRQPEGDLGARLRSAFDGAFREGADHVLVVGSDHPTLPADLLDRGLAALGSAQMVVGPTADGGYYAVGLARTAWPEATGLFEDIPWSTPRVLEASLRRARRLGLSFVELPEWYDVDEPADLARLSGDLEEDSATARCLERLRRAGVLEAWEPAIGSRPGRGSGAGDTGPGE